MKQYIKVDNHKIVCTLQIGSTANIPEGFIEIESSLPAQTISSEYTYVDGGLFYVGKRGAFDTISPDGRSWVFDQALKDQHTNMLKSSSLFEIDTAAGKARLKYITSVPGQAETYQKKEEQARIWAAAEFAGSPPSFIEAEATALNINPVTLAEQIIALADYWGLVKGPEIESSRRKWKVAIEAATDIAGISTARDSGLAELATL